MELGCDRVRFHLAGPVLEHPLFDQAVVLAAFKAGPFHLNGFRTQEAEEAIERLQENPTFEETPMCYERMANWLCGVLRKRDRSAIDRGKLNDTLEEIMRVGHASAMSKQESNNFWTRCDTSFEELQSCLDEFLESTADLWDWHIAWLEGQAVAAKFALKQSLRATTIARQEMREAG